MMQTLHIVKNIRKNLSNQSRTIKYQTFLSLLLLPLYDDRLLVLPLPPDVRHGRAVGLAHQGGVVVLADAHGGGGALEVVEARRDWKIERD